MIVAMNMVERKVSVLQGESYSEKNTNHEQMLLKVADATTTVEKLRA